MIRVFRGLHMAFGMFCAIPVPYKWDESSAGFVMPCLPVVGALVGAIWWGAAELLALSGIHAALAAGLLMLIPFIAAGFIHLDGYMDTSDAVLSRRSTEEKLRILRDPHAGAFAVIMVAALFIVQFAASYAAMEGGKLFVLLPVIAVISRSGSAISILCLKTLPQSGYASMFKQGAGAGHRIVAIYFAACAFAVAWLFAGFTGIIVAAAAGLGYIVAMACAYRSMKGVSGDLAGFALVISEVCGLAALAVV
jgi:adenosylcobinamide-GDP ribazoletransferase